MAKCQATVEPWYGRMIHGGVPMPSLEVSDAQVVELVKQLPPERQREALLALAAGAAERRNQRMQYAEEKLRRVSAERGMNWDEMSEDQRENLIDDLLHEDRPCAK